MMKVKILMLMIAFAVPFAIQAQTIVYDFNDSGNAVDSSWSTGFQTTDSSNLFSQANGIGVGGTGAVGSNSGSQVWSTTTNSFAGNFQSLTMSIAFEWDGTTDTSGDFTFGFSADNPGTYAASGVPTNSIAGGFKLTSTTDVINLELQSQDTVNTELNLSGSRALTAGNWYEMETNFTYDALNGYDGDITIYNYNVTTGVRGSAIGGTMGFNNSVPSGLTSTLSSDSTVWAFIGGRSLQDQTLYFDNFSVNVTAIPEPSAFALVGIALGAVMLYRRRK
jgi:hypothetical protein